MTSKTHLLFSLEVADIKVNGQLEAAKVERSFVLFFQSTKQLAESGGTGTPGHLPLTSLQYRCNWYWFLLHADLYWWSSPSHGSLGETIRTWICERRWFTLRGFTQQTLNSFNQTQVSCGQTQPGEILIDIILVIVERRVVVASRLKSADLASIGLVLKIFERPVR